MQVRTSASRVLQLSWGIFILGTCYLIVACSSQEAGSSDPALTQQQLIDDLNAKQNLWFESGAVDYSFSIHKECVCPEDVIPAINVDVAVKNRESVQHKIFSAHRQSDQNKQSFFNEPESMEQYFGELRQAILLGKIHKVTYDSQYGFPVAITFQKRPTSQSPDFFVHTRNFDLARTQQVAGLVSLAGTLSRISDAGISRYWLVADNGQWYELKINPALLTTVENINNRARIQVQGVLQIAGNDAHVLIVVSQIVPDYTQTSISTLSGILTFYLTTGSNSYRFQLMGESGDSVSLDLPGTLQTNAINLIGKTVAITGYWNSSNTQFIVSQLDVSSYTPIEKVGRLRLSPSALPNSPIQFLFVDANGLVSVIRLPEALQSEANRMYSSQAQVRVTGFLVQKTNEVFIEAQQMSEVENTLFSVQATGLIIEQGISFPGAVNNFLKLQTDTGTIVYLEVDPTRFQINDSLLIGARIQIAGEWLQNTGNGLFYIAVNQIHVISLSQTPPINLSGYIIEASVLGDLNSCSNQLTQYKFMDDNGRVLDLLIGINTQVIGATSRGNNFQIGDRVTASGFQQGNTSFQVETLQILPSLSIPFERRNVIAGTIRAIYDSCIPAAKTVILQTDNNQLVRLAIPASVNPVFSGSLENGKRAQFSGLFSADNSALFVTEMTVFSQQPQLNLQGTIIDVQVTSDSIKLIQLSLDSGVNYEVVVFTPGTIVQGDVLLTAGARIRVVGTDLFTGLPRIAAHQITIVDSSSPSAPGLNTSISSMRNENGNVVIVIHQPEGFYIGANYWLMHIGSESFVGIIQSDPTLLVVNIPKAQLDSIPNGTTMTLSYGSADPQPINLGVLDKNLITQPGENTHIERCTPLDIELWNHGSGRVC